MSRGNVSKAARKFLRTPDPSTAAYVITNEASASLGDPRITVFFSDDPQGVRTETLGQWDIPGTTPTDPAVFETLLMARGWRVAGDWCEAERGHWFVEVEKRDGVINVTIDVKGVEKFLEAVGRMAAAIDQAAVALSQAGPAIEAFRAQVVESDERLHESFLSGEEYKDSPDERLARELDSAGVEGDPEFRRHQEHDGTPRDDCSYCPSADEIADETDVTRR